MVSKRVKYARAHLSRRKHTALLARPLWRRLQKDINASADPFTVSRTALKFHPTKRIKIMAQPKFVKKKYDPAKEPPAYPKIHPSVLVAKASNRIQDLSLPQKRENWRKKLNRSLSKPADWERHEKVLERIAKPKSRPLPSPLPFEKLKGKRKYDPAKVDQLAQPVAKGSPPMKDPFKVLPGALKYEMTDQMRKLAYQRYPRKYVKPRIPGKVSKAALKFTPNERIDILAKPSTRPPGKETDLRENAFEVSPAALKAWCSPRIKILAKHKSYKG